MKTGHIASCFGATTWEGRGLAAALGKVLQGVSAGAGFFGGYLWAVRQWADRGGEAAAALVQASLSAGLVLSLLYAALLVGLFWPWIPAPKAEGIRAVACPAAFALSLLVGALGMQGALFLLG